LKNKNYHNVVTAPESNRRQIIETEATLIPLIHTYSLYWLGT
jgi:hypothetical protein